MGNAFQDGDYVIISEYTDTYRLVSVRTKEELVNEIESYVDEEGITDEELAYISVYRVVNTNIKVSSKIEIE